MARKVFFSFHYERDSWRAGQVRNSGVIGHPIEGEGFIDKAEWESIERQGDYAIQNWIDSQLKGTSVTVVLIGRETNTRRWVKYELQKSHERGNGIVGVYIHNVKDHNGNTDAPGFMSFGQIFRDRYGYSKDFLDLYKVYDWHYDNGRVNLTSWIEEAARNANK